MSLNKAEENISKGPTTFYIFIFNSFFWPEVQGDFRKYNYQDCLRGEHIKTLINHFFQIFVDLIFFV